jgi:hypothetical protein
VLAGRRDVTGAAAVLVCLSLIVVVTPASIVQDSWLTLVTGRLVSEAGVPTHNLLTVWAHGKSWIDQQWLAQLAFYRSYALAGMTGVVVLSSLLISTAWVGALLLARRRGTSGAALCLWAPATALAAPWAWQVRAQAFALPLFVALLALVFADARCRSRRVFLALPVLALWGNVHGTALLGACLLTLHAVVTAVQDRRAGRAALLTGGGFLALTLNPYGLGIASYYRTMTLDPPFASLVVEWKHTLPSLTTAPFYVLAAVAIAIVVRHRRELTRTELAVGAALLLAALDAVRSTIWFALVVLILVPPLVQTRARPTRFAAPARMGLLLGAAATLVAGIFAFSGSVAAQTRQWPTRAVSALDGALARHPHARVIADNRYADYLLWQVPQLRRRLLADVRFELLTRSQLEALARFEDQAGPSQTAGAEIAIVDPSAQPAAAWRDAGWRRLYGDAKVAVYELTAASA